MRTPAFKYWRSKKDDQWYWHLAAANGEVVAQSEGYTTRDSCLQGIQAARGAAEHAIIIEKE